jgi:6-phosphogluconolactonase
MLSNAQIIIRENPTELAMAGVSIFSEAARDCLKEKQAFAVAISGGSTPRQMHRILAEEAHISEVPWDKTHIFWVDERCVPRNDPASNYGTAKKDFLDRVPIPGDHIHAMRGEMSPEDGALTYQAELVSFFQSEEGDFPVIDLIFLGVGKDGHTASLFPGDKALDEMERTVVAVKGGDPFISRLTMTYAVLNRARRIVFLLSGRDKADIVKTIFEGPELQLPAQKIRPLNGTVTWILDGKAASLLSEVK